MEMIVIMATVTSQPFDLLIQGDSDNRNNSENNNNTNDNIARL